MYNRDQKRTDPNRTRTDFLKSEPNQTEPEPTFWNSCRTERNRTELESYNFGSFRISIKFRRKNVNENTRISPLSALKQVTSRKVIK
jgi:hypothetical protein